MWKFVSVVPLVLVGCVCAAALTGFGLVSADIAAGEIRTLGSSVFYLSHVDERAKWKDADELCVSRGGHLASIHNADEQELLSRELQSNPQQMFWIGLRTGSQDAGADYYWSDGSRFDYGTALGEHPWSPMRIGGKNFHGCVHMAYFQHHAEWNKLYCAYPLRFVCRIDTETRCLRMFPYARFGGVSVSTCAPFASVGSPGGADVPDSPRSPRGVGSVCAGPHADWVLFRGGALGGDRVVARRGACTDLHVARSAAGRRLANAIHSLKRYDGPLAPNTTQLFRGAAPNATEWLRYRLRGAGGGGPQAPRLHTWTALPGGWRAGFRACAGPGISWRLRLYSKDDTQRQSWILGDGICRGFEYNFAPGKLDISVKYPNTPNWSSAIP